MDLTRICNELWTIWLVVWLLWAFQSKQTRQRESLGSRISYTLFAWAALYLIFFAKNLGPEWNASVLPYSPWMGWAGIAITALGFVFTFWARAILGGNWSGSVTIKVGHELIRTGPYRFVRHPIYTGIVVAMAGTALAYDQWRSIAAVILVWISFSIKRLKEEQFMHQTFGEQYVEYSRSTGAIFPLLVRRNSSLG